MAVKVDILADDRWFTNSPFAIDCHIKQADEVTPQDISGWTFIWVLKKRVSDLDANAILAKASPVILIIDAPAGHARIPIAKADTDGTVKSGVYHHELKRNDPGFEVPVISGLAHLRQSAHLT